MREIHGHEVNECNKAIRIYADDQNPDNGNASHHYVCTYPVAGHKDDWRFRPFRGMAEKEIDFQDGPIKEVGTNGITQEVLLTILIDRLEGFQTSKYANGYNETALAHCKEALAALNARTAEREKRGVEGTHEV